jgi:hypothetical protein
MVPFRIARQDIEVSDDVATLLAENLRVGAAEQRRMYYNYPELDAEVAIAQKIEDRLVGAKDTAVRFDRNELVVIRHSLEMLMLGPLRDEATALYTLIDEHLKATEPKHRRKDSD